MQDAVLPVLHARAKHAAAAVGEAMQLNTVTRLASEILIQNSLYNRAKGAAGLKIDVRVQRTNPVAFTHHWTVVGELKVLWRVKLLSVVLL